MKELELSLALENAFQAFSLEMDFDRDTIMSAPAKAIDSGLRKLEGHGAISKEDLRGLMYPRDWGNMTFREVLATSDGENAILDLIERLRFWRKRNEENVQ